ncbi:MAG: MmgE/PrpD family protein [Anaerolineae bacterium]
MGQVTLTRLLARFVHDLSPRELPAAVLETAKDRILDALSTSFAGHALPWSQMAVALVKNARGNATIVAHPLC